MRTALARGMVVVLITCSASMASATEFLDQVKANFAGWDANHDGKLSKDEIDAAISNPKVMGKAAAAAACLRRAVHSKTANTPDLTLEMIAQMSPHNKGDKTPDFDGMYDAALARIQKSNKDLFASGTPSLTTLRQGRLGDCFCLAPLGAMVNRDPQQVVDMFSPAPGSPGMVTVTFGGKRKVTVPMPTDGEIAIMASTGSDGVWVNAYEKAVGVARAKTDENGNTPNPLNVVTKGGSAGVMVEFVTGHQIKRFSCSPWRDAKTDEAKRAKLLTELRAMLTEYQSKKRLICGGTGPGVKVPGAVSNHAYAILHWDAAKDEVTLWNPQGITFKPKGPAGLENGYEVTNGKFTVPLTQLVTWFGGFSFETDAWAN
jgi:hypothetical protein